jgi:hypothetical protein
MQSASLESIRVIAEPVYPDTPERRTGLSKMLLLNVSTPISVYNAHRSRWLLWWRGHLCDATSFNGGLSIMATRLRARRLILDDPATTDKPLFRMHVIGLLRNTCAGLQITPGRRLRVLRQYYKRNQSVIRERRRKIAATDYTCNTLAIVFAEMLCAPLIDRFPVDPGTLQGDHWTVFRHQPIA